MMKFAIAAVLACSKQAMAQAPAAKDAGWWTPDAEAERSLSIPASTMEDGKAEAQRSLSGMSGRVRAPQGASQGAPRGMAEAERSLWGDSARSRAPRGAPQSAPRGLAGLLEKLSDSEIDAMISEERELRGLPPMTKAQRLLQGYSMFKDSERSPADAYARELMPSGARQGRPSGAFGMKRLLQGLSPFPGRDAMISEPSMMSGKRALRGLPEGMEELPMDEANSRLPRLLRDFSDSQIDAMVAEEREFRRLMLPPKRSGVEGWR